MSGFCVDCKHARKLYGVLHCERTRTHHVDNVTGKQWSVARTCSGRREYLRTCEDFEQKPTLIQRLKEVFS